jgi:hypothetical protein
LYIDADVVGFDPLIGVILFTIYNDTGTSRLLSVEGAWPHLNHKKTTRIPPVIPIARIPKTEAGVDPEVPVSASKLCLERGGLWLLGDQYSKTVGLYWFGNESQIGNPEGSAVPRRVSGATFSTIIICSKV